MSSSSSASSNWQILSLQQASKAAALACVSGEGGGAPSKRATGNEEACGRPGDTYTVIVSIQIEVYFGNPVERGAAERKPEEEKKRISVPTSPHGHNYKNISTTSHEISATLPQPVPITSWSRHRLQTRAAQSIHSHLQQSHF